MEAGVLRIEHAKFGVERFAVGNARCNLFQREDEERWELVIAFRTTAVIQRSDGWSFDNDAKPHVEASAILREAPLLEAGTVIVQDEGYDHETDENLSVLYYFEHESIEKLHVTIVAVTP